VDRLVAVYITFVFIKLELPQDFLFIYFIDYELLHQFINDFTVKIVVLETRVSRAPIMIKYIYIYIFFFFFVVGRMIKYVWFE
jgi:hypothetical protein